MFDIVPVPLLTISLHQNFAQRHIWEEQTADWSAEKYLRQSVLREGELWTFQADFGFEIVEPGWGKPCVLVFHATVGVCIVHLDRDSQRQWFIAHFARCSKSKPVQKLFFFFWKQDNNAFARGNIVSSFCISAQHVWNSQDCCFCNRDRQKIEMREGLHFPKQAN